MSKLKYNTLLVDTQIKPMPISRKKYPSAFKYAMTYSCNTTQYNHVYNVHHINIEKKAN